MVFVVCELFAGGMRDWPRCGSCRQRKRRLKMLGTSKKCNVGCGKASGWLHSRWCSQHSALGEDSPENASGIGCGVEIAEKLC